MPLTQESYIWLTVNSLVSFIKTVKERKKLLLRGNTILFSTQTLKKTLVYM